MQETLAAIAGATWLLTAVLVGILSRWVTLTGADKQGVSLIVAAGLTAAGYATGYVTGDPVEIAIMLIVALFGANLLHDKIEKPLRKKIAKP